MTASIARFRLGDRDVEVLVQPGATLLSVLRGQLGMTATKEGCRQGGCGSCTVLVDGDPMLACILPVEDIADRQVTTLESITPAEDLDPIQRAFVEERGFQCGYCTPGMVMLATALLERDPAPDEATIVEALSGNICRCTGYAPIIRAIQRAADLRAEAGSGEATG